MTTSAALDRRHDTARQPWASSHAGDGRGGGDTIRHAIGTVRAHGMRVARPMIPPVIPSAYKNRQIPWKSPLCAICMLQTRGRTVRVELTHDVSVHLCVTHASEEFRTMRSGRDFCTTLLRVWQATNALTRNRAKALQAHLARCQKPASTPRALPGSYHWKALRNEVEHRAAAGEATRTIVVDLRQRHAHDVADVPSARTIRRWYHDRRWEHGRTSLRRGYARRDPAKAGRAQKDRARVTRLRETYAAERADPAAIRAP